MITSGANAEAAAIQSVNIQPYSAVRKDKLLFLIAESYYDLFHRDNLYDELANKKAVYCDNMVMQIKEHGISYAKEVVMSFIQRNDFSYGLTLAHSILNDMSEYESLR